MKVKRIDNEGTHKLSELRAGDTFLADNVLYLFPDQNDLELDAAHRGDTTTVLDMEDDCLIHMPNKTLVTPVEVTVTYTFK